MACCRADPNIVLVNRNGARTRLRMSSERSPGEVVVAAPALRAAWWLRTQGIDAVAEPHTGLVCDGRDYELAMCKGDTLLLTGLGLSCLAATRKDFEEALAAAAVGCLREVL